MDPHFNIFSNRIRGRLVDIRSSGGDSISYYRHGVNGDNKSCVGILRFLCQQEKHSFFNIKLVMAVELFF
jgi:hypothetical protein